MRTPTNRVGAVLVLLLASGCGPAGGASDEAGRAPSPEPAAGAAVTPEALEAAARADSVRRHYTEGDVAFMRDMIHHHAQALVMAGMAPTHGASPALRTLAARIINGQKDEIALMQRWLRERGEPVPEVEESGRVRMPAADAEGAHTSHAGHAAPGHGAHAALMAGMLSAEQMARLEAARGPEWDRLFLTYMIQHHQGAVVMVEELFATYGAAQGDEMFKIASDIGADQRSEIDRMQRMLRDLVFQSSP
jgi:uncharacterized protein (DUF305 family)